MTAVAKLRRPRRIAADEAHAWARNLRLGNSLAKLVLSMCTLYVDGEGRCFPGIEALAEDTELSVDTVRKRLAWLEQVGAIARFPQWIDESGRRNSDGRGKRTSDEIRLLMDADPDEIERHAKGHDDGDGGVDVHGSSPSPQQGLNGGADPVSPRLAPDQPSDSGKGLISEPEPEDSPQAPLRGVALSDSGSEADITEGWEPFREAFEADGDPIVKVSIARRVFGALSPDERKRVTRAARGLIVWRRLQKKPPAKPSAQTFLREVDAWASWEKHTPPENAGIIHSPKTYERSSREGLAIAALFALARSAPTLTVDGCYEITGFDLTPQMLALADAPPERDWPIHDDRKQLGAWNELLEPLKKTVACGEHVVGKRFVAGPDGKQVYVGSDLKWGFKVPWDWPPRVDGTVPKAESEST